MVSRNERLEHPDVAITLNNLAAMSLSQARFTEAATMYRKAVHIFEKVFGPADPRVVYTGRMAAMCAGKSNDST